VDKTLWFKNPKITLFAGFM